MRELYRSDYFTLTIDEDRRLICRARTAKVFPSLDVLEAEYEALLESFAHIDRTKYVCLVDVRAAPARNDPAFEAVVNTYYRRLYRDFPRIASLVRTQVGRLQVTRMAQRFNFPFRVFNDEASALEYLFPESEGVATKSPSSRPEAGPLGRAPRRDP